jgi:hypothetical protein
MCKVERLRFPQQWLWTLVLFGLLTVYFGKVVLMFYKDFLHPSSRTLTSPRKPHSITIQKTRKQYLNSSNLLLQFFTINKVLLCVVRLHSHTAYFLMFWVHNTQTFGKNVPYIGPDENEHFILLEAFMCSYNIKFLFASKHFIEKSCLKAIYFPFIKSSILFS